MVCQTKAKGTLFIVRCSVLGKAQYQMNWHAVGPTGPQAKEPCFRVKDPSPGTIVRHFMPSDRLGAYSHAINKQQVTSGQPVSGYLPRKTKVQSTSVKSGKVWCGCDVKSLQEKRKKKMTGL